MASEWHEFTEDVNDASMCMCGVPALAHDEVFPETLTGQVPVPPPAPIEPEDDETPDKVVEP